MEVEVTDHRTGRDGRHELVTGGLGFIGSFVTESFIEAGDRVTVVDSCVSSVINPAFAVSTSSPVIE